MEVEFSALPQFRRQIVVPDEGYTRAECCIAEYVVWMFVGVDNVSHRLAGDAVNGSAQCIADRDAAAGVHDRDCIVPDDDAEIRNVSGVSWGGHGNLAEMDEVAGRHLFGCQYGRLFAFGRARRR